MAESCQNMGHGNKGQHREALDRPVDSFVTDNLGINDFWQLPIALEHIWGVANLPLHHRDPFDRILIAQSIAGSMTIVSADAAFDGYAVTRLW